MSSHRTCPYFSGSDKVYQSALQSEDFFESYHVYRQRYRRRGETKLKKPFLRIQEIMKREDSFKIVGVENFTQL